jgi:nucleotide-binding universal stress UspA family protein
MPALKVLAPLDQSSRDRILLPHLVRLSEVTRATIHLLHVVAIVKSLTPHAIKSAESYVDAFVAQLHAQGVDAHGIVRKGDVVDEIVKVAAEYEVDSIIMSTRGRRGFDKLLIGSVAEAVMNNCPHPVTLINEATSRNVMDERVWTQSSYMAGVIWNKVARGVFTDDQALAEMQRLEALGLDHDVLKATYTTLQKTGGPAEWLDIDFQLDTLEAFMPEDLKGNSTAA